MSILSFGADDDSVVSERAEHTLRAYAREHAPAPAARRSASHSQSCRSSAKRRRATSRSAASAEHSAFAPPLLDKGAVRFSASASRDDVSQSMQQLGIEAPEHQDEVRGALAAAAPIMAGEADDASASFERRHATSIATLYGADACPICEETTAFKVYESLATIGDGQHGGGQMNRQQRLSATRARVIQARANLADGDQRRHLVLYRIELAMRGRWADERIFRLLLVLRREWIEKNLEYFEIPYVPWTLAMLRNHYDPERNHFYQPVRAAMTEYKRAQDLHKHLFEASIQGGTMDFRAVAAFKDMAKVTQSYREEIDRRLDDGEPNIAEALRVLASAVARTTQDAGARRITEDPETAAGRAQSVAEHEPHGEYAMSHISAH